MLTDALKQSGPAALIGIFMGLLPLGCGLLYAWRPSEQRLAVMRPLSLAAIFAAIHATALGIVSFFRWIATTGRPPLSAPALIGLSESFVPIFFSFGCLMIGWLCVAIGMSRRTG